MPGGTQTMHWVWSRGMKQLNRECCDIAMSQSASAFLLTQDLERRNEITLPKESSAQFMTWFQAHKISKQKDKFPLLQSHTTTLLDSRLIWQPKRMKLQAETTIWTRGNVWSLISRSWWQFSSKSGGVVPRDTSFPIVIPNSWLSFTFSAKTTVWFSYL